MQFILMYTTLLQFAKDKNYGFRNSHYKFRKNFKSLLVPEIEKIQLRFCITSKWAPTYSFQKVSGMEFKTKRRLRSSFESEQFSSENTVFNAAVVIFSDGTQDTGAVRISSATERRLGNLLSYWTHHSTGHSSMSA